MLKCFIITWLRMHLNKKARGVKEKTRRSLKCFLERELVKRREVFNFSVQTAQNVRSLLVSQGEKRYSIQVLQ